MTLHAILLFHQGYTDIINCLPIVSIYQKKYNHLYICIRQECNELLSFYTSPFTNIHIITYNHQSGCPPILHSIHLFDGDLLFFGDWDIHRRDKYKGIYQQRTHGCLVQHFYLLYDLDYNDRITQFSFQRNFECENKKYNEIVNPQCTNYIVCHDTFENKILQLPKNIHIIQLDHISNIFFDCIKILENAHEFYFIDSVWACLCYLIDCKYKLFHNKKIYVYCFRGYESMFEYPIKLQHWNILSNENILSNK